MAPASCCRLPFSFPPYEPELWQSVFSAAGGGSSRGRLLEPHGCVHRPGLSLGTGPLFRSGQKRFPQQLRPENPHDCQVRDCRCICALCLIMA